MLDLFISSQENCKPFVKLLFQYMCVVYELLLIQPPKQKQIISVHYYQIIEYLITYLRYIGGSDEKELYELNFSSKTSM